MGPKRPPLPAQGEALRFLAHRRLALVVSVYGARACDDVRLLIIHLDAAARPADQRLGGSDARLAAKAQAGGRAPGRGAGAKPPLARLSALRHNLSRRRGGRRSAGCRRAELLSVLDGLVYTHTRL